MKKNKVKVGMAIIATVAMLTSRLTANTVMAQKQQQGTDWSGICNQIQGQLVNSDGSFTSDGQHVHDCIQNGILLGGGVLALGLPLPLVIPGLKALSDPTGCNNIVNWDALNSGTVSLLTQIFHK